MSEIMQFLKTIDEEYLIGLSNKGIVKRSYKDLETVDLKITQEGEEILGQYEDVSVRLKLPLTNSTCSCPSTSICKHVIMTILTAQKNAEGNPKENANSATQAEGRTERTDAGQTQGPAESTDAGQTQRPAEGTDAGQTQRPAEGTDIARTQGLAEGAGVARTQAEGSSEGTGAELAGAILELPAQQIKKALSGKEWIKLLTQTDFTQDFLIQKEKLITIRNVKTDATVKLFYPLERSTCSICHDEKLCFHKAGAILAFQMQNGAISLEGILGEEAKQSEDFDEEDTPEVLKDIRNFLEELLMVGSARLSQETPLGLERLALRAHNAKLPSMEEQLRVLSENVAGYLGRKARISAGDLMRRIAKVYGLLDRMEKLLLEEKSILPLAGTFRSEYEDVPELLLHGVGMRQFESDSGYAGKTIYFFEENTQSFYTYTVARPTIYEKNSRRSGTGEAVPWGLHCSLLQLSAATVRLQNGKANDAKRLSSTSQAQAELITVGGALPDAVGDVIYDDFEQLWIQYGERHGRSAEELPETEKLFFIRAKSLQDMHYDEIEQKLVFWFQDLEGRCLKGELAYSKQEETAIKSLERLERKLSKGEELPVFLGTLYVEDGEGRFYPIETIGAERLAES